MPPVSGKVIAVPIAVSVILDCDFRSSGEKTLINFDETLQLTAILFALLTTEEMMCSIIQGSGTTDPFATEWSFLHSTGGPVYVKC